MGRERQRAMWELRHTSHLQKRIRFSMITSEKVLERKLREGIEAKGGLALKFTSPGFTGVPDRLVLMPQGKVCFAEVKSVGKKLEPRQKIVKKQLERLGFEVHVIDSEASLLNFLK